MKTKALLLFFGLLMMSISCKNGNKKDLVKIEQQELATGIRHDSLFQGLYLGMARLDFLTHCWEMNKKNVFTEGVGKTVEYQLGKRNFHYDIQMNFYPQFIADKISAMPMKFTYRGKEQTFPDVLTVKLVKDVRTLMEEWYGTGFFITALPTGQNAYAQVSGNRRVLIFSEKEFEVMVIISDLTAEK